MRDVEAYIGPCLHSVLRQASGDMELLVLDDASTDASLAAARRSIANAACRAELFRHDAAQGVSRSRNELLQHARGEYVWFVDSDDIMLPGALAALKAVLRAGRPDLVLCDHCVLRDASGIKHRLRGEHHRSTFQGASGAVSMDRSRLVEGAFLQGQMHVWSKVARRAHWQAAPFPDRGAFEDISVSARLLAGATRWVHVDRPWIAYRQRAGSIMDTLTPDRLHGLLDAIEDVDAAFAETATANALDARARFAVDYFRLRSFASIARQLRLAGADAEALRASGRAAMSRAFPDGVGEVIAGCLRRGWWLRAWRLKSALSRVGWI